jgi:hypothetical protein
MKSLILAVLLLFAPFAFAQDEDATVEDDSTTATASVDREPAATNTTTTSTTNKNDNTPLNQKARYRLYPGGQDEQDLQVQSTLPQPQRTHDSQQLTPVVKTTGEE